VQKAPTAQTIKVDEAGFTDEFGKGDQAFYGEEDDYGEEGQSPVREEGEFGDDLEAAGD
jgi:hypothetical protein